MNESEKLSAENQQTPEMAQASPEAEANIKVEEVASTIENVSEKPDDTCETPETETCVEKESPAMSLAETADELVEESEEGEEEGEKFRRFHDMTKEELAECLKEILDNNRMDAHKEAAAIKGAFFVLRNNERDAEMLAFVEKGNDPAAFVSEPDETENLMRELLAEFKEKRAAHLAEIEEKRNANLAEKIRIIDKLSEIVSDIDNVNVRFSEFQQLQQDFKKVGEVPPGSENETWKSYQVVVEQFYDHLKMNKELRDLDFRKNLEAKRQLIDKAKELSNENDVIKAFRALQTLHDEWRGIGPVAKELRESIWDEFKEASTVINKRHQDYFLERKAREKENEEAKTKLCEEAEDIDMDSLNSFAAWDEAMKHIIDIQARWKQIGFASRKVNNELFARFRALCDKFFERKNQYYKKVKEEFAENLARKTALCEKAEALLEREDRGKAANEMLALQAEWRTIGNVGRKNSDAVWKRFSTAANTFFESRKKENAERHGEENANLAIKKEIIGELKKIDLTSDRRSTIGRVRELQNKWQATGHVPFKVKDSLFAEYRKICDEIYNSYDRQENRRRMSNFRNRVDTLRGEGKVDSEKYRLERALETKKNELATYENNLGFFNVKTSAGSSMIKELERKIKKIKEDMTEISEKIKVLARKEAGDA